MLEYIKTFSEVEVRESVISVIDCLISHEEIGNYEVINALYVFWLEHKDGKSTT